MAYFELTTWKHSAEPYAGKHQVLAVITCPSCEKEWVLSAKVHQVSLDGTVVPSVICPVPECDFHAFVKLKDWTFPDWFMSKTMESFIADCTRGEARESMPRRWCSVHNREEFKYESLEHELHATAPRTPVAGEQENDEA